MMKMEGERSSSSRWLLESVSAREESRSEVGRQQLAGACRCYRWGLFYMVVTFSIGVLLRMQFVFPVGGFPFSYVVHAHSHVGFLGWVFNGFFALAYWLFVKDEDRPWFWRLFWLCQVGVVGMLVTFPVQGYALWSIVFSTLHLVCSMAFVWRLMKRSRAKGVAACALKIGGWMLLVSSLGPFAMGPIMVTELRDTIWRDLGVYYYLHFQYNGWFVFFLIAAALQRWGGGVSDQEKPRLVHGLVCLATGVVLTYAQSALWVEGVGWIRWVAAVGGAVQMYGVAVLAGAWTRSVRVGARGQVTGCERGGNAVRKRKGVAGVLAWWSVGLFVLKVVLQWVAVLPGLGLLSTQHFMVIAFLHLVFLGVVTPLLWAWGIELGVLKVGAFLKAGVLLFAWGAIVSQCALVWLPLSGALGFRPVPYVFEAIFYASVAMLVACGGLVIGRAERSSSS